MFDVSLTELMVIGVVALIVIGPERLPKVARTIGHLLGRAQRYVNDVKSDIQREIELDELRKFKSEMETAAQDVQQSLNDTHNALQEPVQQFRAELDEVAREASGKPAVTAGAETATASADPRAAAPADPLMTPQAGQPAEAPRSIAPPNPNLSLDLDSPAAAPAAQPAPTPQPAPAPHAPAASEPPPATKPATPSGTTT